MTQTPYDALLAELRRDAARPFLTFYDDATGERVELSVATFDNWVAKTASFLRDGLSAEPGDRVALVLPAHWQALAWTMACWAVGAEVLLGDDDGAAVAVTGPNTMQHVTAPDVVALSLRPLGARFNEPLPDGVIDYAVEVPTYPDHLVPYDPPEPGDLAFRAADHTHTFEALLSQARSRAEHLRVDSGARILVATDELDVAIVDALLVPLVVGGSAVLVRNEDRTLRSPRVSAEKAVDPTSGLA